MDDTLTIPDTFDPPKIPISTLVFMDLETTGLPNMIGKRNVHITEISFVAINRKDFEMDTHSRVINKLSLCVRPRTSISPGAMSVTGLYNDMLENQDVFDDSVPKLLKMFFCRLRQPICLLAHNGKNYDFPLLQAELKRVNESFDQEILCADTLIAFRSIGLDAARDNRNHAVADVEMLPQQPVLEASFTVPNETFIASAAECTPEKSPKCALNGCLTHPLMKPRKKFTSHPHQDLTSVKKILFPDHKDTLVKLNPPMLVNVKPNPLPKCKTRVSYSLENLYNHFFGEKPPGNHHAESDCINLSKICQKISKKFLKWVDENSIAFSDVMPMW